MDDPDAYARAKKRVRQIRGFYIHATVYALVNAFLIALNVLTSTAGLWSVWPLLGWGIGLAAHGVATFGFGGLWGADWEQRKIKELMEKRPSP
jgi:hypothetical protein